MSNNYKLVKEQIEKVYLLDIPTKPTIPSLEIRKLRASLILEEAIETIHAMGLLPKVIDTLNPSRSAYLDHGNFEVYFIDLDDCRLHEILDGLTDLDVVGRTGTALVFGFSEELMKEAEEEVHRSNMSKLWTYEECLEFFGTTLNEYENPLDTMEFRKLDGHKAVRVSNIDDRCFQVTNKLGKTIKSPSYTPVNMKKLIDKYL